MWARLRRTIESGSEIFPNRLIQYVYADNVLFVLYQESDTFLWILHVI